MIRYFQCDNATIPIRLPNGGSVQFKPVRQHAGMWMGILESDVQTGEELSRVAAHRGICEISKDHYEAIRNNKSTARFDSEVFAKNQIIHTNGHSVKKIRTAIIQLERHGDIINILPVAKAIRDRTGIKPVIVTTPPYSQTVEGASYTDVAIWQGDPHEVTQAKEWAESKFGKSVVTQLNGKGYTPERTCESFDVEQWNHAGMKSDWGKLPLVFDRRIRSREEKLCESVKWSKPVILLALKSVSSPFQHTRKIQSSIFEKWKHAAEIVDLSKIQAERVFDLLGLFDRAAVLVTVDTMHLHLAAASSVGVCAFIADSPMKWRGSNPRCKISFSCRYSDATTEKSISDLNASIERLLVINNIPPQKRVQETGAIYHVTEMHQQPIESERRCHHAWNSWNSLYRAGKMKPVHLWKYPRSSKDIGDTRDLPYLKDVLREGLNAAKNDLDIICLTNDDTILHSSICELIHEWLEKRDAISSFRVNYDTSIPALNSPVERIRIESNPATDLGRDMFAFRKRWLVSNWHRIPDMILGEMEWDLVLALMIRESNGFRTESDASRYEVEGCCEIPKGYVIHLTHEREWTRAGNFYSKSKVVNRNLSSDFYDQNGYGFLNHK